jgi:hypothetical protein
MNRLINDRDPEWDAPDGATFVCGACGKHGQQRDRIGDESCFLNAILCETSSLVVVNGMVREAKAWKP